MKCLSSQSSPGKILMGLCSLPWSLRPCMLSMFCVSQFLPGSNHCCGFLIGLFHCGAPLILCVVLLLCLLHRGGLLPSLLCTGGLMLCLLRCGGLLSCLLCTGGLQLCLLRLGGLLPCLLRTGGLLLCLLRLGGLLHCLLRTGGLLLCLLCRGGLLLRLVHPGGLQSCLLRPGGFQSRLLHPGGLQFRPLRPGVLQFSQICTLCRVLFSILLVLATYQDFPCLFFVFSLLYCSAFITL